MAGWAAERMTPEELSAVASHIEAMHQWIGRILGVFRHPEIALEQHRAIYDAIRNRDTDAARTAMRHIWIKWRNSWSPPRKHPLANRSGN